MRNQILKALYPESVDTPSLVIGKYSGFKTGLLLNFVLQFIASEDRVGESILFASSEESVTRIYSQLTDAGLDDSAMDQVGLILMHCPSDPDTSTVTGVINEALNRGKKLKTVVVDYNFVLTAQDLKRFKVLCQFTADRGIKLVASFNCGAHRYDPPQNLHLVKEFCQVVIVDKPNNSDKPTVVLKDIDEEVFLGPFSFASTNNILLQ